MGRNLWPARLVHRPSRRSFSQRLKIAMDQCLNLLVALYRFNVMKVYINEGHRRQHDSQTQCKDESESCVSCSFGLHSSLREVPRVIGTAGRAYARTGPGCVKLKSKFVKSCEFRI